MEERKVVYIAGPITGVENYEESFLDMEFELAKQGNLTALSPASLPPGMSREQYMRICFAMIDTADAVILLNGWEHSAGARLELQYCQYIGKPYSERLDILLETLEETEVEPDEAGQEADQGTEEPTVHCRVQPRRVVGGAGSAERRRVRVTRR